MLVLSPMRLICIVAIGALLSGCATARQQCEVWQREGYMFSTPEACIACVKKLGSSNKDVIRGCALGLDSAELMNLK